MYSVFNEKTFYGSLIEFPDFDMTAKTIATDVLRVIDYYRSSSYSVPNQHLLVRLIDTMSVPLSYDLGQYYEVSIARSMEIASMLHLTTALNTGMWFDGVFYAGSKELVIAFNGSDNPFMIDKGWRDLQAVRVIDHPVSNLSYMLPNGARHNVEYGYAYISVDIAMLMVQYRAYILNERRLKFEDPAHLIGGTKAFVARYVLPNMLKSQTDLVIWNRLINLFNGAPMGVSLRKHPIPLSNYSQRVDRVLNECLKRVTNRRMEFANLIHQVPVVFSSQALQTPDIAETRQVWWALFISRLKEMNFLWDVAGKEGRRFNNALINQLKIDLNRFRSDNVFASRVPIELQDDITYFKRHVFET